MLDGNDDRESLRNKYFALHQTVTGMLPMQHAFPGDASLARFEISANAREECKT